MTLPDKTEDFIRDPSFERRVVAFYDILGWRSHIARAGTDPRKIGELRRMILRFGRMLSVQRDYTAPNVRFSTFSDNVVISQPVERGSIVQLLGTLGCFALSCLSAGFLVRGGITVGDIYHDEHFVFGPALNRAYELESAIASVPRIILDPNQLAEFDPLLPFITAEDGIHFIDPYTRPFISHIGQQDIPKPEEFWKILGIPMPPMLSLRGVSPDVVLTMLLENLKPSVCGPLAEKEWQKVAWLYDRIAAQLGVPLARSYPQILPEDAQK